MSTDAADKELFDRYCELKHKEMDQLLDKKLAGCRQPIVDDIHEIRMFVDQINTAFVKDAQGAVDYTGHHMDHYARMKAAEAEQAFWVSAKSELVKGGVGWLLGVVKIVVLLAIIGAGIKLGWVKTP
jgi:hypothetical protein